jgi:hypothetical protein
MSKKGITGESGTLFNYPDIKIDRPFAGGRIPDVQDNLQIPFC